MDSADL